MSDEAGSKTANGTTDALLRRISELESAVAKANGDAKKYRLRLRDEEKAHGELKTKHETLATEHETLKTKSTQTPDEWKTRHDELLTKLQARDARDEWAKAIGANALHEKATVEKVWAEIGYTPGEAAPTPEEIAAHLTKAREIAPYLFADKPVETTTTAPGGPTKTPRLPLKETVGVGRGAPDTNSSRVKVTKAQLQDPKWKLDPINSKMIADASAQGVLDIVDG